MPRRFVDAQSHCGQYFSPLFYSNRWKISENCGPLCGKSLDRAEPGTARPIETGRAARCRHCSHFSCPFFVGNIIIIIKEIRPEFYYSGHNGRQRSGERRKFLKLVSPQSPPRPTLTSAVHYSAVYYDIAIGLLRTHFTLELRRPKETTKIKEKYKKKSVHTRPSGRSWLQHKVVGWKLSSINFRVPPSEYIQTVTLVICRR